MAQDVTIAGATYNDVPSIVVPKANSGDAIFVDPTPTTAEASDVVDGKSFFLANGTLATGNAVIPEPATSVPIMDGTAAVGTSDKYAREDHVHPTDTSARHWKKVRINKGSVTLTANKNNANQIDFSTEVNNNKPSGYTFDHLEFLGAWPADNWNNFVVTRVYSTGWSDTTLILTTSANHSCSGCYVNIWYYKDG